MSIKTSAMRREEIETNSRIERSRAVISPQLYNNEHAEDYFRIDFSDYYKQKLNLYEHEMKVSKESIFISLFLAILQRYSMVDEFSIGYSNENFQGKINIDFKKQDNMNDLVNYTEMVKKEKNSNEELFNISFYTVIEISDKEATLSHMLQKNEDLVLVYSGKNELNLLYNAKKYSYAFVKCFTESFLQVLEQFLHDPSVKIINLEFRANNPIEIKCGSKESGQNIIDLFSAQVKNSPQKKAVVFQSTSMTYQELDKQSTRLAIHLMRAGVGVEDIVGIHMNRSCEMIVVLIGILKAGAAFVSMDPEYPIERINYMLEDSNPKALVTTKDLAEAVPFNGKIIEFENLDDTQDIIMEFPHIHSQNLAYVIYTSGSTGKPKGVLIEHLGILKLQEAFVDTITIKSNDNIVQFASLSFDASLWEIFMAMLNGCTLFIPDKETIINFRIFEQYLQENNITVATLPPSYAIHLEPKQISLRILITAGESPSLTLIEKFGDQLLYFNAYGPTETTICASTWKYQESQEKLPFVPIGKTLNHFEGILLNEANRVQPLFAVGELCITGEGLARGYLNREELTEEKFIEHPLSDGKRIYKTGDLAVQLANGDFRILGRIDNQVKYNGFRIECSEIESTILKMREIVEAVVCVLPDAQLNKKLCCFYMTDSETTKLTIMNHLKDNLPDFMIPNYYEQLPHIPKLPNGKVDKKELTDILFTKTKQTKSHGETGILAEIQSILGSEKLDSKRTFFENGGDSIKAGKLLAALLSKHGISFSFKKLAHASLEEVMKLPSSEIDDNRIAPTKSEQGVYPLNHAQLRIYYLQNINPDSVQFNLQMAWKVPKLVTEKKLRDFYEEIINHYPAFRIRFINVNGQLVQALQDTKTINADFIVEEKNTHIDQCWEDFIKPFDLAKAPLLRMKLIRSEKSHYILMDTHHIIFDGVSSEIFTKELERFMKGEEITSHNDQFLPYCLKSEKDFLNERASLHWRKEFVGNIEPLQLMLDGNRESSSEKAYLERISLGRDVTISLKNVAKKENVTLFVLLLVAYKILIQKYLRQNEFIIGIPINVRESMDDYQSIGMYVNTLPIPSGQISTMNIRELITHTSVQVQSAYEYKNYPLDRIAEMTGMGKELISNMFTFQKFEDKVEIPGWKKCELPLLETQFPFMLEILEESDDLVCNFKFKENGILVGLREQISKHYQKIVQTVVHDPFIQVNSLNLVTEKEFEKLKELNSTKGDFPKDKSIIQVFEEQAIESPYAIAVSIDGISYTYEQLRQKVDKVAELLQHNGAGYQKVIGLSTNRSIDMIAGILGILKLGAIYLPIDPDLPDERLNYMLADTQAEIFLTDRPGYWVSLINIKVVDVSDHTNMTGKVAPAQYNAGESTLAYIIYTSGSTGKPKGTLVTHQNVMSVVMDMNYIEILPSDNILQVSNYAFDGSVFDIFGALLNGASLTLIQKSDLLDIPSFRNTVVNYKVNVMFLTTALFNTLVDLDVSIFHHFRKVLFGGEKASKVHVQKAIETCGAKRFSNMYGPTETTVFSTFFEMEKYDVNMHPEIPIGIPVTNTKLYVFNEDLVLQAFGIEGELYIGGEGVCNGYLNNIELTEERFIDNPIIVGEKLYRTGDMVKWLPDGNLLFLNRADSQVKIRGFRVEKEEIRKKILDENSIRDCLVHVENGEIHVFYLADEELVEEEVLQQLKGKIPEYMIPNAFHPISSIPLTQNDKVDYKTLMRLAGASSKVVVEVKMNTTEKQVATIWEELLGRKVVRKNDSFYKMGGQSLKMMEMVFKLNKEFSCTFTLAEIMELPTIRGIAEKIDQAGTHRSTEQRIVRSNRRKIRKER